jgi:signal transduction histidine kinase
MNAAAPDTILLLEDDDLDAELIAAQLTGDGIALPMVRAKSEGEYLAHLRAKPITLVLSDFSLPSYGGMAALDAARALAPKAPFIFVSGAIGEERAIETMRRGATDYVLKSRLERLGPAVRRALAEADGRRRREEAERQRDELLMSERQAREAAEAANRLKDEFLAVVSHELRTPLNAIVGWASLLLARKPDEEKWRRGIETILRNARMQARLIEDILDISRIVSGKLDLDLAPVSVESFVSAAVDTVRPSAAAKEISLEVNVADDVREIYADGERLQQVVWNLAANAVKFTGPNGLVKVRARAVEDGVEIEVADTGQGIEPALLPHVFEPFRQGDASTTRAHRGLGLGLAIVRHLVEMHGGKVTAASDGQGRGATFRVRLPTRARPARPEPLSARVGSSREDAAVPAVVSGALAGVSLLLVDDEAEARDVLGELLRSNGAEVVTAGSVGEALAALGAFLPDVIVSDIGMPHEDGYSFIRRLRGLPPERGGTIPAIALTAYVRELDRAEASRAGYQLHLTKPISPGVLARAIEELLGGELSIESRPAQIGSSSQGR